MAEAVQNQPFVKILIAGERSCSEELSRNVVMLGYAVVGIASTGQEAFHMAAEFKPDLCLLDAELSGSMDGIEALRQIAALLDIPALYVVGVSDDDFFEKSSETESYGYLAKPVSSHQLKLSIESALHRQRRKKPFTRCERELSAFQDRPGAAWDEDWSESLDALQSACEGTGRSVREILECDPELVRQCASLVKIGTVNEAALKTFGCANREDFHDSIVSGLLRGDLADFKDQIIGAAECGRDFQAEGARYTRDGRKIILEVTASVVALPTDRNRSRLVLRFADITERRIRESEQRLALALEGSGLGLWDWNMKNGEDVRGSHWSEILGYSADEIEDTVSAWVECIHPDDRARVTRQKDAHLNGTTPSYISEHRLRAKSGEWKWIQSRGAVVERDELGKPLRMVGAILDIHEGRLEQEQLVIAHAELEKRVAERTAELSRANEQLRMEALAREEASVAIRESEEKYRLLFCKEKDAIVLTDAETFAFLDANESAERLWGYSKDELLGMNALDLSAEPEESRLALEQGSDPEGVHVPARHHRKKDGTVITVEISTGPFVLNGRKVVCSIVRDVSERKKAEDALEESARRYKQLYTMLRLMCDNVPDLIWAKNIAGEFLFANRSMAEKLLNAADTDEPIGKTDAFFGARERQAHPENYDWHTFAELCCNSDAVVRSTRKPQRFHESGNVKGEFLVLDVYKAPLWNEQGEMIGTVGCARDVTREKRTEEFLRESEERNRFLANVIDLCAQPFAVGYLDGTLGIVNKAYCDLVGYSADELKHIDWYNDLTPPEFRETGSRKLKELTRDGKPVRFDQEYRRKDGTRVPVELLVHVASDARGKALYYYSFITDLTDRKAAEEALKESEARVRMKLDSILLPGGDIGNLDLGDVFDTQSIQILMDYFYDLTSIPLGIADLDGKVLAATGWQDICTKFHRVHPETSQHCLESDTVLSGGIEQGAFKIYRCKNNMWDVATPVYVGGKLLGNLFLGQFFFEDESPDYESFRAHARKHGFDEQQYMAALEKVPRWSKETVNAAMLFFTKLAHVLSTLSYSNIQLARSLAERERLVKTIQTSEAKYRLLADNISDVLWVLNLETGRWDYMSPSVERLRGYTVRETLQQTLEQVMTPESHAYMQERIALRSELFVGGDSGSHAYSDELEQTCKDGTTVWTETVTRYARNGRNQLTLLGISRDVTERKRAQELIRESEQRYRVLFENMLEGFAYCRMIFTDGKPDDFVYLEVNDAFGRLTGLSDVVGRKATEVMPGIRQFNPDLFSIYGEVALTGKSRRFETYLEAQGIWLSISVYSSKRNYFIAVFDNITDHKRAEEALRASEEKYRATFNNAAVGIDLTDDQGRFLEVNHTLSDLLGYTQEELQELTILDVTHPDDVETSRDKYNEFIAGKNESYRFEKRYVRKDGEIVWANTSVSAIRNLQGKYRATVGVIADITKRRKAEEVRLRLEKAVEQAAETIEITDADGTILYVNPAFERTTGYSSQEAIGNNPRIVRSGVHDEAFYRNLWKTISSGGVWSGHFINEKKNGGLFEEEATISPIKDETGKIANYVAVKRDVTKEVSLQKQLLQAQKMEAIGTLAGGIAHDFNNLLQVTLGYSELLLSEKRVDDKDYADLQKIYRAARSGAELVKSLLTFSRKLEPKPVPMNLNVHIGHVQQLLRRTIPKMIEIRFTLAQDLPRVNADPAQIEQILMNLALNSRDAIADRGSITIETANVTLDDEYCRLHQEAAPGHYVRLSVSDTGHGIDRDTMEHVFEPFFTTKDLGRGTGLGLAMVYGIVKQHNGYISCSSDIGRGATFNVYLPAMTREPGRITVESQAMPASGTETLLLVDDEKDVRDLGGRILARSGYKILNAANGKDALHMYERRTEQIDLVILDLIMPEMGGSRCLDELLKLDPQLKIIIASGFSAYDIIREVFQKGARGFVSKPFKAKDLLVQVRQALDSD
ncbi:MAG TPA: PAS domain S-box protein [Desulfomonilaceae bacterium]|nr:PAS domain S-box protein [Desulfomonilaceae bacterium]